MTAVVDTSVLVDYLRGHPDAARVLEDARAEGPLHASEVTRLEILAGMRPQEETATVGLLSTIQWHPLDEKMADEAGKLGRQWLSSHSGIDTADLAVAATAKLSKSRLLTRNVRHFPMFGDLRPPY